MTKPAPGPDQPPIPVRLLTFNIRHGVGADDRLDLPRLAKVLQAVDADVVCLQEVDRHYGSRSEDVDQPLLLSRALDMQLAWGPAIEEPRGPDRPARGPAARAGPASSTATRCCPGCRSSSATSTRCPAVASPAARCGRWSSSTAGRSGSPRPTCPAAAARTGGRSSPPSPVCTPTRWSPASSSATSTPPP